LRGVFCQHLLIVAVDRCFRLDGQQSLIDELGAEAKRLVFAVDSVLVPLSDGVSVFYIQKAAQQSRSPGCGLIVDIVPVVDRGAAYDWVS
jgi:hypothetical protein